MWKRKKSHRPLADYRMTFQAVSGDVKPKLAVVVKSGNVTVRLLPVKIFLYCGAT